MQKRWRTNTTDSWLVFRSAVKNVGGWSRQEQPQSARKCRAESALNSGNGEYQVTGFLVIWRLFKGNSVTAAIAGPVQMESYALLLGVVLFILIYFKQMPSSLGNIHIPPYTPPARSPQRM